MLDNALYRTMTSLTSLPKRSSPQERFLTYREFTTHVSAHKDPPETLPKKLVCPKQTCWYATIFDNNTLPVSKAKYFIHHYMREHKIKRYLCRYCPTSFYILSSAYTHLADAHPSYPIDIIEREYKKGGMRSNVNNIRNELHYEQLRRIHNEAPLTTKRLELIRKEEKPMVLNQYLGATSLVPSLLDEPLVAIDEGGQQIDSVMAEEDPLSLENEEATTSTTTTTTTLPVTVSLVDSDASNQNFDASSISHVSINEESDSMDTDFETAPYETTPNIKMQGFNGKQLFKCLKCNDGFDNSVIFRMHLSKCIEPQAKGALKPYRCYHCNKDLRSVYSLAEHIKIHGTVRYKCSLCDFKHPSHLNVRNHMKTRHAVNGVTVMPIDPKKNDTDRDEFIMRPKPKRKSIGGGENSQEQQQQQQQNNGSEDATKIEQNPIKTSYSPTEIDLLPRQPIYSTQLCCAICNYSTKVRTNLVRHLEFHSMEKVVPTTAPINPVPCLEKNEKMFDKMTNLALSSFTNTTTRMGGKVDKSEKLTKEEEAELPIFIPTTKRYVCGAIGCNYLCLEESLLRHHLLALHADESIYYCKHCNRNLCEMEKVLNIDAVMKHLKLHDLHLYKCAYCKLVHNLKHKIERHISEKHLDKEMQVIVVRKMDCEPETVAPLPQIAEPIVSAMVRPWHCCMCKSRAVTREEIVAHVDNKHDIGEQYKCPLCTYKDSTKDSFAAHYTEHHPDHQVDIITAFIKADEIDNKNPINKSDNGNFDTTPLWQRDKQRVRHIRGILFDECGKLPKKLKMHTNNLDRAIEAVVNAEDESVVKSVNQQKIETLDKQISATVNDIMLRVPSVGDIKTKEDDVIVIDDDGKMEESEVMGTFGPFGEPFNNKFLCPLCATFKTRNSEMVRCHLYEELQYYRYRCKLCDKKGIEHKFLMKHLSKKHQNEVNESNIDPLPTNNLIEKWVNKVLEVQGKLLKKEDDPVASQDEEDREQVTEVVVSTITDAKQLMDDALKRYKCTHCVYKTKYLSDLRKHERRHLLQKPLKCGHCDFEGVVNSDIAIHSKKTHKDLEVSIVINKSTLPPIVPRKRKAKQKPQSPTTTTTATTTATTTTTTTAEKIDVDTVLAEEERWKEVTVEEEKAAAEAVKAKTASLPVETVKKKYKCLICGRTSDSYVTMRADHIRSHFKPFECAACKKRFNYPHQVTTHYNSHHKGMQVIYNVVDGDHQRIKNISTYLGELKPDGSYGDVVSRTWNKRKAKVPVATAPTPPSPSLVGVSPKKLEFGDDNELLVVQKVKRVGVKNVACKSTTKQSVNCGFSFYGVKPDYGDLTKITTTITINNAAVTRTVEQFSHIFNLYPNVVVEDCMRRNNGKIGDI